jgi:hypothetical protein
MGAGEETSFSRLVPEPPDAPDAPVWMGADAAYGFDCGWPDGWIAGYKAAMGWA